MDEDEKYLKIFHPAVNHFTLSGVWMVAADAAGNGSRFISYLNADLCLCFIKRKEVQMSSPKQILSRSTTLTKSRGVEI